MKLYLFSILLLLAIAPQRCAEDTEDGKAYDEAGYVAEDVEVRRITEEWGKFIVEEEDYVCNAEVIINNALQKLDDPDTKNKIQLKITIARAEGKLEQLSEKLQRGKSFTLKTADDEVYRKLDRFKEHFFEQKEALDDDLEYLDSF